MIFFCAVVLILSANNAFACTCIESSFEDSQKQNSKIFSGKVIRVQTGKLFRKARIRVENVWKGSLPKTITVTTMANGSLCAYKFLFGKSYLIYTNDEDTNDLSVGTCSRTALLSEAKKDLEALNNLQQRIKSSPK